MFLTPRRPGVIHRTGDLRRNQHRRSRPPYCRIASSTHMRIQKRQRVREHLRTAALQPMPLILEDHQLAGNTRPVHAITNQPDFFSLVGLPTGITITMQDQQRIADAVRLTDRCRASKAFWRSAGSAGKPFAWKKDGITVAPQKVIPQDHGASSCISARKVR